MYCPIKKIKKRTYKDQIIIIPSPLVHETPTVTEVTEKKSLIQQKKKKKNRTKKNISVLHFFFF